MRTRAMLQERFADLRAAILTFPPPRTWLHCLLVYAVFSAIALSIGLGSGLLRPSLAELSPKTFALLALTTLLSPALMEELIFRVLPLPRDATRVTKPRLALISTASLVAFVVAHPLSAWLFRPAAWALFTSPEGDRSLPGRRLHSLLFDLKIPVAAGPLALDCRPRLDRPARRTIPTHGFPLRPTLAFTGTSHRLFPG